MNNKVKRGNSNLYLNKKSISTPGNFSKKFRNYKKSSKTLSELNKIEEKLSKCELKCQSSELKIKNPKLFEDSPKNYNFPSNISLENHYTMDTFSKMERSQEFLSIKLKLEENISSIERNFKSKTIEEEDEEDKNNYNRKYGIFGPHAKSNNLEINFEANFEEEEEDFLSESENFVEDLDEIHGNVVSKIPLSKISEKINKNLTENCFAVTNKDTGIFNIFNFFIYFFLIYFQLIILKYILV